jgi:CHAT domain-containing protein
MERDSRLFDPAAGWDVVELSGTDVTRERVLAALPTARIAHLTCHGYLDSRQHLDSGLLLAHAGARPSRHPSTLPVDVRHEHLLTPRDIAAASMRLSLATLRACSAGAQDRDSDEGVSGLAQSLLRRPAGTVSRVLNGPTDPDA